MKMTEESVRIPSEVEAAFILLREITRQLRQAERDNAQTTAQDETAYGLIVEKTRRSFDKALRTIARIKSFEHVGETNKKRLERAEAKVLEINAVREEVSKRHAERGDKLSEPRQQRKEAIDQIANLAEPNGDSDID